MVCCKVIKTYLYPLGEFANYAVLALGVLMLVAQAAALVRKGELLSGYDAYQQTDRPNPKVLARLARPPADVV